MGKESSTTNKLSDPKTQRQVKHSKDKVKHPKTSRSTGSSASESPQYSDSESSVNSNSNYDFSFNFFYDYDTDINSCLSELMSVIGEKEKGLTKYITCKIVWFESGIEPFKFITKKLRNSGFDVKEQHCSSYDAKFIIYWGSVDHTDEGKILEKTTIDYFSDFGKIDPFQLTEDLYVDDPYCDSHDDENADIMEFCSEILNKCKQRNSIHEVYMKCFFTIHIKCNYNEIVKILRNYGFDVKTKPFVEGGAFNVEFYVYWGPFEHSKIHEGTFLEKVTDVYFTDFEAKYLWLSIKRAHDDDSENGGSQFQYTSLNQKKDKEFLWDCLLYEGYSIEELFRFCDISIRSDKEFIEDLACEHLEFQEETQISPVKYLRYVNEDLKKDKEFVKRIVDVYSVSEEVYGKTFDFADESLKTDIEYVKEVMDVDSVIYRSLPMNIKEDDGIIRKAISERPNLLNYVPQRIRNDYKELAMESKRKLKNDGNYSKLDNLRFGKL
jgi:hypothetical protein